MPVGDRSTRFRRRARRREPAVDNAEFGLVVADAELRVCRAAAGPRPREIDLKAQKLGVPRRRRSDVIRPELIVQNPRRLITCSFRRVLLPRYRPTPTIPGRLGPTTAGPSAIPSTAALTTAPPRLARIGKVSATKIKTRANTAVRPGQTARSGGLDLADEQQPLGSGERLAEKFMVTVTTAHVARPACPTAPAMAVCRARLGDRSGPDRGGLTLAETKLHRSPSVAGTRPSRISGRPSRRFWTTEPWDGAGSTSSIFCVVRRGKAMAAVSPPRTATTNISQNASWKAFAAASPRSAVLAAPAISPARDTRTVDRAATPTAPPISRMVSTSPDARPVIECMTPDRTPICAAGALSPPPTPARSNAGGRSVAYSPPAGTRVSNSAEMARREAGDEQTPHAYHRDEPGSRDRDREERGRRGGQPGDAGPRRRITENLLHQQRAEEDEAEDRTEDEKRREVRRDQRAVAHPRARHQR
jgi:hypothetical protein